VGWICRGCDGCSGGGARGCLGVMWQGYFGNTPARRGQMQEAKVATGHG